MRYKNIPVLEIKKTKNKLEYRWKTDVLDFKMPIDIKHKGKIIRLYPTNDWEKSTIIIKNTKEIEILLNKYLIHVAYK